MENSGICIIGGGAAGMLAGVILGENRIPVTVVEAQGRIGKKLLSTGNGRCNLTNLYAAPERYFGDENLLRNALESFPPQKTLEYFEKLGLYTQIEEEGRVYPRSQTAASVLDALRLRLEELGTEILCGAPVTEIKQEKAGFSVRIHEEIQRFNAVLLTCGGCAASGYDGYRLLNTLGVSVEKPIPALCPIPVKGESIKSVKGLRARARVMLYADGNPIRDLSETGEVQFADRALSGICIFNLSRWCNMWLERGTLKGRRIRTLSVGLDLLPEIEDKYALLRSLVKTIPERSVENFLSGLMPRRLGMMLVKMVWNGALDVPVRALPEEALERLAEKIGCWSFEPRCVGSWNQAQVTAGGVSAAAVDEHTMEVRGRTGLYLAGEILDIDGPCGGFNLQWAWSSAAVAAKAIVRKYH